MASTSTRQPEVGEGWVRKADNTYFIVVKIEPTTVTLISKAQLSFNRFRNDSVQLSLNRFRNDYSYKDKGVQADEAWALVNDIYLTDGSVIERVRSNGITVWETRISFNEVGNVNIPISTLLRSYQHTASPLPGAASSSASTVQNDGSGGGRATSKFPFAKLGEGWVRNEDKKYFIVVKIDPDATQPTVTLISKDNKPVQFLLFHFTNYYTYKDKGVQAGEAWVPVVTPVLTPDEVFFTDGSVIERVRSNRTTVWETRISIELEEEASVSKSISDLLRHYQHTASPLSGTGSSGASISVQNDGSGGGGGATSNATIDLTGDSPKSLGKQGKRKRETEAKLKKKGVCPVCQDDIFSNKEGNVFKDRIKQQNDGKLQIGYRTVKILKCCGNAIHYTCYLQWKENKTCPACGVDWNSLLDEDRVRDPEDVAIKSTEQTVTVDTVVYRLSCQLKF